MKHNEFPEYVFVTTEEEGNGAYGLLWETQDEAAQNAADNNGRMATYRLIGSAKPVVHTIIELNDKQ